VVGHAFEVAGDVPMTCAVLAGFCLGVFDAEPYLPPTNPRPESLIAAACQLASPLHGA
jgi:hypothetical protein